jgi:hypothetical protein
VHQNASQYLPAFVWQTAFSEKAISVSAGNFDVEKNLHKKYLQFSKNVL